MKFAGCLLLTVALFAQKDFLTADEADQIRLAQEPNIRLKIYTQFARQRIDLIEQAIKKDKAGRSGLIHEYLDEYTKIIEAIDTVTDDALRRKAVLDEGVVAVANAERQMLDSLKKIVEANPKDLARYDFALNQAIETTQDSLEMAQEDLAKRSEGAAARDQQQRKELEDLKRPIDPEAPKPAEPKSGEAKSADPNAPATDPSKPPRKPPTLRRKGETSPPAKP